MELPIIPFSYNWNKKLCCDVFTTVRLKNPKKYQLNGLYSITLSKGKSSPPEVQGNAKIILMQDFNLYKVSEGIALIDTGYNKEKFIELVKTMYKNSKLDFATQLFTLIFLKFE